MGYAFDGVCWPSAVEAAQHVCGAALPVLLSNGAVMSCTGVAAGSTAAQATVTLAQCTTTCVAAPRTYTFAACDPLTFTSGPFPWGLSSLDGALIGGAIAAVWIVGAVWRSFRRALGDHNADD